jgi:hypothetical protein
MKKDGARLHHIEIRPMSGGGHVIEHHYVVPEKGGAIPSGMHDYPNHKEEQYAADPDEAGDRITEALEDYEKTRETRGARLVNIGKKK